jgi:hypothetical protein
MSGFTLEGLVWIWVRRPVDSPTPQPDGGHLAPPTALLRRQKCRSEKFGVAGKQNLTIVVHLCSISLSKWGQSGVTQMRSLADWKTLAGFAGLIRVGE